MPAAGIRTMRPMPLPAPRLAATALLLTLLGGCASAPPVAVREYLDEQTAASVTVAGDGIVFARPRTEYAVNARDYVTVVPVDVNRGGSHALYLYCYVWSTIERPNASEAPAQFALVADGRMIELAPAAATPRAIGLGQAPVEPPALNARVLVAATTREALGFLVKAQELSVAATREDRTDRYALWADGRAALVEFLQGPVPAR